ncbi:Hypothetical predicted protein, partial [Paramuricea clavata]
MDAKHSQIGFEIEALQCLLILSDPDFENNQITKTPSDSPSTTMTNPIPILPKFTTPVDTPTSTSHSHNTIDTTPTSTQTQPSTPTQSPTTIPSTGKDTFTLTSQTTSQPIIPQNPQTHQTITTPQAPITPTNTHHTTTIFNKLVELNHRKNYHQRQLTILNKHLTNHTAPAGLDISVFSPTGLSPHAKTTIRSVKSNTNVRMLNYNVSEQEDVIANLMNLPVAEDETKLVPIVKIFVGYTTRVIEHECEGVEKSLVKNLAAKDYKTASHAAFNHPNMKKLAEYKGIDLINDCQAKLPLTYGFVSNIASKKSQKTAMSKKVLALSSVLNSWIPKSKFVYRCNVILTAGGCKKAEIETFHKLGEVLKIIISSYNNQDRRYRIVGDNWDIDVKSRSQTTTVKMNKSLHYFHMYAVADRVYQENASRSKPQKSIKSLSMDEFLPTPVVQEAFVEDLTYIIPHIL